MTESVEAKDAATTTEVTEERTYTPDEQRAMEFGWKPKEEWDGNPDDWISAKEFNFRGELFGRIAKDRHEIKETREAMKKLFEHNRKLFDAGYKKAIEEVREKRIQALEEGDHRKVDALDQELGELRESRDTAIREFEKEAMPPQPNIQNQIAFEQWTTVNSWYTSDPILASEADNIARQMVESAQRAGRPVEYNKLLVEVAKQVKTKHPEKFGRTKESSPVDGGSKEVRVSSAKSGRNTLDSLPAADREIAKTFIEQGILTEEEYVKQWKAAR